MDADQELFERIRARLEQDADVLRWTDRKTRQQLLHRVAQLAAEEARTEPRPATWETARARPLATTGLDDPRDVLIGRLARLLDVADGGHHSASFDALLAGAVRLNSGKRVHEQARTPRAVALSNFLPAMRSLLRVGPLDWDSATSDLRLLVANLAVRRQLEAIEATLALAQVGLGHLSVCFVRPALEEELWVQYLAQSEIELTQRLLLNLANHDGLRSIIAQWDHLGDDVMADLWYPNGFRAAAETSLEVTKERLKTLRVELGWSGGRTPPTSWVAEKVGESSNFDYLHSATSRALHFSAGEAFRRSWGEPGDSISTQNAHFNEHLCSFAMDQLWRLVFATVEHSLELPSEAGIYSDGGPSSDTFTSLLQPLLDCGRVPLVHAHEWNLTPEGPLSTNHTSSGGRG